MAYGEVIVISDDESEDESDGKDNVDIVTESDNDSTSYKRRAWRFSDIELVVAAINTAVVSAAIIYMLLKQ